MTDLSSIHATPVQGSRNQAAQPSARRSAHGVGLRVIAVYKAIKTIGLILIAIASFHLYKTQNFDQLVRWLEHLSLADSNGLRWKLVQLLEDMGPNKFVAIGLVALAYAAIFATEGIGLWLHKYWAEWFTVIATGSLIPIEVYETIHHFTWLKIGALIANVLIVIYLIRIALQSRAEMKRDAADSHGSKSSKAIPE